MVANFILVVSELGLAAIFLMGFRFSDSSGPQLVFGVAGTMLAIIAAAGVFIHQAVEQRVSHWAARVVVMAKDLADSDEPDQLFKEMKEPNGQISVAKELLEELDKMGKRASQTVVLLIISLVTGALAIFGPEFSFSWCGQTLTQVQVFGSVELASTLIASVLIGLFVVSKSRSRLVQEMKDTIDKVSPDSARAAFGPDKDSGDAEPIICYLVH